MPSNLSVCQFLQAKKKQLGMCQFHQVKMNSHGYGEIPVSEANLPFIVSKEIIVKPVKPFFGLDYTLVQTIPFYLTNR